MSSVSPPFRTQIQQFAPQLVELKTSVEASVQHAKWFFRETPTKNFLGLSTTSNHPQCANSIVMPPVENNHLLFFVDNTRIRCYNTFLRAVRFFLFLFPTSRSSHLSSLFSLPRWSPGTPLH